MASLPFPSPRLLDPDVPLDQAPYLPLGVAAHHHPLYELGVLAGGLAILL
jgi:hypothetical protein